MSKTAGQDSVHIIEILAVALDWDRSVVEASWTALKDTVWAHPEIRPNEDEIKNVCDLDAAGCPTSRDTAKRG